MTGHVLAVGELYDPTRTNYPTKELLRLGRTTHELVRCWPGASDEEIAAHDEGSASFALVDESPDLLVLAYQFGDLEWSDSPFQIHRLTSDDLAWPCGGPGEPIMFRTVLLDSSTGRILSLRYDAWPLAFSNAVRVAVAEQLLHEFSDQRARDRLDALYREYPTPAAMVDSRPAATCKTDGPAMGGGASVAVHYY